MNRRQLLKLLASGVVGLGLDSNLDLDRLLWIPNQKTIFLPSPKQVRLYGRPLTLEMVEETMRRILIPRLPLLFERDDMFYQKIERSRRVEIVSARELRIPLHRGEK